MLTTLAAVAVASLVSPSPSPSPQQGETDTTFAVPAGASLNVNNFGGEIVVHAWKENRMRVHAEHGSRNRIDVSVVGNVVTIKTSSRYGAPSVVDFDITVPQSTPLTLNGTYTEITVEGVQAAITAETVQGEVKVRGGNGIVTLHSVEGLVTLADAKGRIEVNSINEGIELTNVSGEITAETVNGDVSLEQIQSSSVDASTINGDVKYEGTIVDGGTYRLTSHNGDLTVSVPERFNATISVATVNGEFSSCFPVSLQGPQRKHRFSFTIGSGSARVELESFQGDIELCRPGELPGRMKHKDKEHKEEP